MVDSLNEKYWNHLDIKKDIDNVKDWTPLIEKHRDNYIQDAIINVLNLCRKKLNEKLNFELIENMNPILRANVLIRYLDLSYSDEKLKKVFENENEAIFITVYLTKGLSKNILPEWATEEFIEKLMTTYWEKCGKILMREVCKEYFKNKNLQKIVQSALKNILLSGSDATTEIIGKLKSPTDIIPISNAIIDSEIYDKISKEISSELLNQFIKELKRIQESIPDLLIEGKDPIDSFRINDPAYQRTRCYILYLIASCLSDKNYKDLKNLFYEIKILFYGTDFHLQNLTTNFAELILLISISIDNWKDLEQWQIKNIQKYLKLIIDTGLLVPFVHVYERKMWRNPENTIRNDLEERLCLVKNDPNTYQYYNEFYDEIDKIKISRWKYET